jgi:hypothetical protein
MVENIFDYNPTERELRRFGVKVEYGHYEEQLAIFKGAYINAKKPDYYLLGILFSMRGEKDRANEYFAKAYPDSRLQLLINDF